MIALLLSLALSADGDEVGGVVLGEAVETAQMECRGAVCQKPGEVAGQRGTFAVRLCDGVAKTVMFSVSFIEDTPQTREHFGGYIQRVPDPRAAAAELWAGWVIALNAAHWVTESEKIENGLPWTRVIQPPHARVLRVAQRDANGHAVFTTSLAAAATDPSCPSP